MNLPSDLCALAQPVNPVLPFRTLYRHNLPNRLKQARLSDGMRLRPVPCYLYGRRVFDGKGFRGHFSMPRSSCLVYDKAYDADTLLESIGAAIQVESNRTRKLYAHAGNFFLKACRNYSPVQHANK